MEHKVLNFEEKNSVDLLYNDDDIMIASIDLFYINDDGDCNRNKCNISMECVKQSIDTFKNKPIIFRYNSTCSDVTEHSHNEFQEFTTRIAGHIPSDSRITFVERENGLTYCNAEAVIQKKYVPQLNDILKKNNGQLKVSIEIKANGDTRENGIFYISKMILQGVCLLGKNVVEGIEGSHLEVLKFSELAKEDTYEYAKYNTRYLEFTQNDIYMKLKEKSCMDYAKKEYGTGEPLKIDKSPESMSDIEWGKVDKIELRDKILNAKNYKTLVYDVYMEVEEGWEDAPSEKLKYPVMCIEGDKVVYARYGLSSALAYAKAQNNKAVVDKVEKLYKTINIDKEGKMSDNEILNKLDEDNPELEKIRDDAESIEDNEKEKLKEEENSLIDKPEDEKLKDDVDSDKDYWKKKFEEIECNYNETIEKLNACEKELTESKEKLAKFLRKEDIELMKEYLDTYKNIFSAEDYEILATKINQSERVDFEKEVDEKIKNFARNYTCEKTIGINNSLNGNIYCPETKDNKDSQDELEIITKKYS